jgi:hypothetical protein
MTEQLDGFVATRKVEKLTVGTGETIYLKVVAGQVSETGMSGVDGASNRWPIDHQA